MHCQEINKLFSAYIDGMLDPSLQNAVKQHIKKCRGCRDQLRELENAVGLLHNLPLIEPPPEFRRELRLKLGQIKIQGKKAGWFKKMFAGSRSGIIAAAAVFILVIGAAYAWRGLPGRMEMQVWQVPAGSYSAESYNNEEKINSSQEQAFLGKGERPQITDFGENIANGTVSDTVPAPAGMKAPVAGGTEPEIAETGSSNLTKKSAFIPAQPPAAPDTAEEAARPSPDTGQAAAGTSPSSEECAADTTLRITSAPSPSILAGEQEEQAFLTIKVDDIEDAAGKAISLAGINGWPVSEVSDTGGRELLMQIPAVQLDRAVSQLSEIGAITAEEYPVRDKAESQAVTAADAENAGTETISLRVRLE